jgi:hypothetical protein
VFGVDKVVWVEGPTEVECFQLLLASVNKRLLAGVSIVQLRATGDLEGRHSDIVADIYRNLSKTASLLPKNAVIIMDGDKRGGKRYQHWRRRSDYQCHFSFAALMKTIFSIQRQL